MITSSAIVFLGMAGMTMIAFKYFNSDMNLLESYLKENHYKGYENTFEIKLVEPKTQLEFSF